MLSSDALGFILYGKQGVDLTNPAVQRALNFTNPLPKAISPSGMGHYGRDKILPVDYGVPIGRGGWPGAFGHDRVLPVDYGMAITRQWPGPLGAAAPPASKDCFANEAVSPVHGTCVCVPGYKYNADYTACIPGAPDNFPNCVDASGKKLPGCFKGYSISQYAPWVIGGAFGGIVLAAIAMAVVR